MKDEARRPGGPLDITVVLTTGWPPPTSPAPVGAMEIFRITDVTSWLDPIVNVSYGSLCI